VRKLRGASLPSARKGAGSAQVRCPPGTARGGHAHKACSQFLVCLRGRISVDAIDGTLSRNFVLEQGDFLNLVPGIYSTETFMDEGSVLAVLCDRPYEPEDYVYDRDLFMPIDGE